MLEFNVKFHTQLMWKFHLERLQTTILDRVSFSLNPWSSEKPGDEVRYPVSETGRASQKALSQLEKTFSRCYLSGWF